MIVGDDITIFAVNDTAACTLGYILTEPAVRRHRFRLNRNYGVFVSCNDFLDGKLASGCFCEIDICCVNALGHTRNPENIRSQCVTAGSQRSRNDDGKNQYDDEAFRRHISWFLLWFIIGRGSGRLRIIHIFVIIFFFEIVPVFHKMTSLSALFNLQANYNNLLCFLCVKIM